MLEDIAIVRWNALLGRYNKQVESIPAPAWSSSVRVVEPGRRRV